MPTIQVLNEYVYANFSPLSISGLVGWWDASDTATITASSGSVSQLDDKSGNGYHLTQATGVKQPTTGTRTINSLNALDFVSASSPSLKRTGISSVGGNAHTFFAVARADSAGAVPYMRVLTLNTTGGNDYDNATSISAILRTNTNAEFCSYYNNAQRQTVAGADDAAHIVAVVRNGDTITGWVDGGSGTSATGLGTTALAINQIWMGNYPIENAGWDGIIGEVIWYNSALGTTDRESVRDYLNSKWAVY